MPTSNVDKLIEKAISDESDRLDLRDSGLRTLPGELFNAESLAYLDLSCNRLETLPPEITKLTKLRVLRVANNKLRTLPNELGQCCSLTEFNLTDNNLEYIPPDIWKLPKLFYIPLDNNALRTVPAEIGCLTGVRVIRLERNGIRKLPMELFGLQNLRWLYLGGNELSSLPPEIGRLTNLEILSVKNNPLQSLPKEIANLTNLNQLELMDDQLTALPLTTAIKRWDVFVSHASEDKESVALPLVHALQRAGLKVWFDSQMLSVGDSLREKIEEGLADSRFGVVIVSDSFLRKRWPARELNGLMAMEEDGQKVILPVWHNVSKAQVSQISPILADRLAADTKAGISAVAAEITDVVLYRASGSPSTLFPSITRRLVQLIGREVPSTSLGEFICVHHPILTAAFGYADVGQLEFDSADNIVFFGVEHHTPMILHVSGVLFARSSGSLFQGSIPVAWLADAIERAKKADVGAAAFPHHDYSVSYGATTILASRRHEFDEADSEALRNLNDSLKQYNIQVRSYDWLIDACTHMDQKHHRP